MVNVPISGVVYCWRFRRRVGNAAAFETSVSTGAIVQFPDVLFQVKVSTKPFGTYITCVWFLVIMGMHMERQIVYLMESFVTYAAFVLLFRAVG